jgi:hypothetical protein
MKTIVSKDKLDIERILNGTSRDIVIFEYKKDITVYLRQSWLDEFTLGDKVLVLRDHLSSRWGLSSLFRNWRVCTTSLPLGGILNQLEVAKSHLDVTVIEL